MDMIFADSCDINLETVNLRDEVQCSTAYQTD